MARSAAVVTLILCAASSIFAADGQHDPVHDLLMHIGLTILAATVLAYLGHLAKQPLILAYLGAGALLGPNFGLGLIKQIEHIAPHAKIIVTAENPQSALKMYEAGADYVFLPRQLASAHLMPIVRDMLAAAEEANSPAAKARRKKAEERLERLREEAIRELRDRHEIID